MCSAFLFFSVRDRWQMATTNEVKTSTFDAKSKVRVFRRRLRVHLAGVVRCLSGPAMALLRLP